MASPLQSAGIKCVFSLPIFLLLFFFNILLVCHGGGFAHPWEGHRHVGGPLCLLFRWPGGPPNTGFSILKFLESRVL